jgi:hypothetical protein
MKKLTAKENGETKVPFVDWDAYSAITKREYFAVLAMQGMLSNPVTYGSNEILVMLSVERADLLLKELER